MILSFKALRKAITELDLLDLKESTEKFVNSTFEGMPNASNNQTINLRDPPLAASKGRPRTLRMKGSLELFKKRFIQLWLLQGKRPQQA
ncbi:unnamed protein product [Trifolium pratense]|uniref:Uncharacterized protein n=1 Tax=Trifolium pratense TaxID=57577 RepID=A0ACB0KWI1_TRIPR|nr:unnamed protein product [Trifolium pratense]